MIIIKNIAGLDFFGAMENATKKKKIGTRLETLMVLCTD
jgi:hypothetical protein